MVSGSSGGGNAPAAGATAAGTAHEGLADEDGAATQLFSASSPQEASAVPPPRQEATASAHADARACAAPDGAPSRGTATAASLMASGSVSSEPRRLRHGVNLRRGVADEPGGGGASGS